MTATEEMTIAEELCQFIKQYVDGYHCLELFRFFGRHPCTQFSELAVVNALNSNRGNLNIIKKALKQLVDKGVVRISTGNNVSLYSMTEEESLRSLAAKLAKLDWSRWQLIIKQSLPAPAK